MGLSDLTGAYSSPPASGFGTLVLTVGDDGSVQGSWSGFTIPDSNPSPVSGSFGLNQGQAHFSKGDFSTSSSGANYLTASTFGSAPSPAGGNWFFLLSISAYTEVGSAGTLTRRE